MVLLVKVSAMPCIKAKACTGSLPKNSGARNCTKVAISPSLPVCMYRARVAPSPWVLPSRIIVECGEGRRERHGKVGPQKLKLAQDSGGDLCHALPTVFFSKKNEGVTCPGKLIQVVVAAVASDNRRHQGFGFYRRNTPGSLPGWRRVRANRALPNVGANGQPGTAGAPPKL